MVDCRREGSSRGWKKVRSSSRSRSRSRLRSAWEWVDRHRAHGSPAHVAILHPNNRKATSPKSTDAQTVLYQAGEESIEPPSLISPPSSPTSARPLARPRTARWVLLGYGVLRLAVPIAARGSSSLGSLGAVQASV